jgi:hypothetical protein
MTPSPFGQAITRGLLSMHPPKARPTQPVLFGAMKDMSMSKGAAEESGTAILNVTLLVGSLYSAIFCAEVAVAASSIALARLKTFMMILKACQAAETRKL